jgi:outer membrane biosynthesis protein TonB
MSLLDRFRSWLGLEARRFDQSIQADTENAAEYIKQRTAKHVADMHRDVEAFFDDMLAEQQRHEDKPLTFGPMPAPAALAAPVKQEPEVPAAPEQAAPAENEHRTAPKAKKKTAPVKQKAEAPAPAMPPEPSAPEQAAPSPEIMDDAALAALIQRDRLAGGRKKQA